MAKVEYKVDIEKDEDTHIGYWLTVHEIQTEPAPRRKPPKEIIERKFYPTPDELLKDVRRQDSWNDIKLLGAGIGGTIIGVVGAMTSAEHAINIYNNPQESAPIYLLAPIIGSVILTGISWQEFLNGLNRIPKFKAITKKINLTHYKTVDEGFDLPAQATETPHQS